MIRRFLVLFSFLPLFAFAEFTSSDSSVLSQILSKNTDIYNDVEHIETLNDSMSLDLDSIRAAVCGVEGSSWPDNWVPLTFTCKAVYDFLNTSRTYGFNYYYTGKSSVDGLPYVDFVSSSMNGTYPDILLRFLEKRQTYDVLSRVQSQKLLIKNTEAVTSVDKNVASITNLLDTPVFNSGTSQTYEYDHLDPSSASMYNAPVVSTSTIQFTGGQNFIKWFGTYSKQIFQAIGRLNSSVVKQQYRIWDLQQKSASITNITDRILQYDIVQSNLLSQIVSDNKKSSDVFSNLWVHTFSFPTIGSERFYFYTFPGSVSASAWPDSTPSNVVSYEVPSSSSLTSILDSFHRNYLSVQSNFFKYLYSFQEQAKDIRAKLVALPSSISTALSGLDVNVVNTVNSSSSNSFNWAWNKNQFDGLYNSPLSIGPIYEYNVPDLDKDFSASSVENSLPPLSGQLNDDLPVLLGAIIRQNATANTTSMSILTNLQFLVGLSKENSSVTNAIQSEMESDSDDISAQVSSGSGIRFLPNSFDEIPQNLRFTSELSSVASVSVSLPDEVVLDFQSFYDQYTFLQMANGVSASDFIFTLNVKPYHWFFRLMRGASIVGLTVLVIAFYIFLLRLFITICIFLVKLIHRSQDN